MWTESAAAQATRTALRACPRAATPAAQLPSCRSGAAAAPCSTRRPVSAAAPCASRLLCCLRSGCADAPVVAMCQTPSSIMEVGFTCSCVANWQGELCETPRDPCDGMSCGAYGTCSAGECTCPPGASGPHCEDDPCRHVAKRMLVDERAGSVYPCVHGTCSGGACACEANWEGEACARWGSMTISPPVECDFAFPCAVPYPELPPPPPPPRGPMQCCRTCNCEHYCRTMPNPGCGVDVPSPMPQPGTGKAQNVCGAYCICTPSGGGSWGCVDDDGPECQPGGSLNVC